MPLQPSLSDSVPETLTINAWTGARPVDTSPLAPKWSHWATNLHVAPGHMPAAAHEPPDEYNWRDPRVGWGLLVADNPDLSESDRAMGMDLPPVLRQLVDRRQGVIIRYREQAGHEFLRRYYVDGAAQDLTIAAEAGVARGKVPKYLLLWASPAPGSAPACIPWRFQYVLNVGRYVGRLHLSGKPLENYVNALLNDWQECTARADAPLVWAVDHADSDITHLMRQVVAEPMVQRLLDDSQIGRDKLRYFASKQASVSQLINALGETGKQPGFVMTTSHGMTGPVCDKNKMTSTLGLLVDQNGALLDPAALLSNWQPNGAIWYAHACCSAGSDSATQYGGLLQDGAVKDILNAVAGLGATVAPLPTALLGAERPLRAFIGHVEPTFDWTLRNPKNSEPTTHALHASLYDGMFRARPEPVGMAFKRFFDQVGQLFTQLNQHRNDSLTIDPVARKRALAAALRTQLSALDRQSCVILGDPAVALPPM